MEEENGGKHVTVTPSLSQSASQPHHPPPDPTKKPILPPTTIPYILLPPATLFHIPHHTPQHPTISYTAPYRPTSPVPIPPTNPTLAQIVQTASPLSFRLCKNYAGMIFAFCIFCGPMTKMSRRANPLKKLRIRRPKQKSYLQKMRKTYMSDFSPPLGIIRFFGWHADRTFGFAFVAPHTTATGRMRHDGPAGHPAVRRCHHQRREAAAQGSAASGYDGGAVWEG